MRSRASLSDIDINSLFHKNLRMLPLLWRNSHANRDKADAPEEKSPSRAPLPLSSILLPQPWSSAERWSSVGAGLFAVFGHIPFRLRFPSCLIALDVSALPQECHPDPAAPDVGILCRKPVNKFLLFFLPAIRNVGRTRCLTGKQSTKDISQAFIATYCLWNWW